MPVTILLAVLCLSRDGFADVYYRMLFERAVFLLETRIEPLAAIPIFQEIIGRHGDDRWYAARSQLYIGLCYKKAGSGQAAQAFRKVLEDYPDQSAVRKIAEAELGGLKPVPAGPRSGPAEAAARLIRRFEAGQRIGGLSGDGRYAVLTETGTDGLLLFDRAERATRRLDRSFLAGSASGFPEQATVSPDGTRIVYSWRRDSGEIELRSIRADGTDTRTLLSGLSIDGLRLAAWEPQGDRILAVLSEPRAANRAVFISAADGSIDPVMELGTRWPGRILPSPDGRYVAYSLSEDPLVPDDDIYLFDIEEKTTVPLVRQAGDDRLIAWTPDSRGIIYAGGGSGTAGIWLLSVKNGRALLPARWITEDIDPFDPIGLDRGGSLYFRFTSGNEGVPRPGGERHELWEWPRFLPGKSRVLTVPEAFPSIQAAIDAASVGDTVLVGKGTYHETVVIDKPLRLEGEERQSTMIVGEGFGSVVQITAGDVSVSGITVSGGTDGIEISSGPSVRRVSLTDVGVTHNTRDGIRSTKTGGYHRIEGCVVCDNGQYGMNVHQFLRSVIRNCEIRGNGTGIRPAWSWYIVVEGNRIHHNRAGGLLIDSCYNSSVSGNLIHANNRAGITIYYIAGRNTIKENILIQNAAGIDVNLQWGGFGENRFYHNDFVGNRDQVQLKPTGESRFQLWDMGESSGGNFWSDYSGGDADGDGLGDSAYELAGGAWDRFPLAKPRGRIRAVLVIDPPRPGAPASEEWLTTRVGFPAGLPAEDVDLTTLLLNGSVAPGGQMGSIGDADENGISPLVVSFSRAAVRRVLEQSLAGREVVITGTFKSGLPFEARVLSNNGDR